MTPTPVPTPSYVGQWAIVSGGKPWTMALFGTTLYVTGGENIDVYSTSDLSTTTAQWVQYGSISFETTVGVAVNPKNGNVYFGDATANTVYQFTSTGVTVSVSTYGFNSPRGMVADTNGNYYVADEGNSRVEEFTPGNTLVTTWTAAGTHSLNSPEAVALDASNNLYIADGNPGRIYELAAGTNTLLNTWTFTAFDGVEQMAVNASGLVYAADFTSAKVEEYMPGIPGPVVSWNGSQGGGTAFGSAGGIVILPNGNILVADYEGTRLEEYAP
jgi:streptogramin lyase